MSARTASEIVIYRGRPVESRRSQNMKKLIFTALTAFAFIAPAHAQVSCWNGSCIGPGVNTHTYNGSTTGTINGQSVNTHTYNGSTTGTIGGQSVRLNTYNGSTTGTIGGQRVNCSTYMGMTRCY
jgi:hypothetical protein